MQNLKDNVMEKIINDEVKMKPNYYFILGSVLSLIGLIALVITSTFLISIISFIIRSHGPMGEYRFNLMINSFPIWIPLVAIVGIFGGIYLLRKYDFSYKKNVWLIIGTFVISIIFAGLVLDISGLNNLWLKRGPMREYFKNYQSDFNKINSNDYFYPGQGRGNGKHRNSNLE